MNSIVLEVRDIHYAYSDGTRALKGLSMAFEKGRRIGIVGPNGAGKTTLFLHLNGVLKPQRGRVFFKGRQIEYRREDLTALRSGVGLVFQDSSTQLFSASVYQELSFGPINLDLTDREVVDRVEEIIAKLNIGAIKDRPTHFLSGGEKKKVAIASVLTMQPEVIVFDEPLANMDPRSAGELMELINGLNRDGKTIVISTHDVNVVYEWADTIYILNDGQILDQGSAQAIFTDDRLLRAANLEKPWILEAYDRMVSKEPFLKDEIGIPKSKHTLYDLISRFSCKQMQLGETYVCQKCGLELQVSHECRRDHADGPCCVLACCGKEMVKKP